jgi:hypothetical protein
MEKRQTKVVKLLEPDLCLGCRFAEITKVEMDQGEDKNVIRCSRLDCDNWASVDDAVQKRFK